VTQKPTTLNELKSSGMGMGIGTGAGMGGAGMGMGMASSNQGMGINMNAGQGLPRRSSVSSGYSTGIPNTGFNNPGALSGTNPMMMNSSGINGFSNVGGMSTGPISQQGFPQSNTNFNFGDANRGIGQQPQQHSGFF